MYNIVCMTLYGVEVLLDWGTKKLFYRFVQIDFTGDYGMQPIQLFRKDKKGFHLWEGIVDLSSLIHVEFIKLIDNDECGRGPREAKGTQSHDWL